MPFSSYDSGDLVVISAAFTDRNSAALDPSTVTFKIKDPNNLDTTYVYGTDAEVVKDSVGNYHIDISAAIVGRYYYRYESTGTGQAAEEGSFEVKDGVF